MTAANNHRRDVASPMRVLWLPVRVVEFAVMITGFLGAAALALVVLADAETGVFSIWGHGISRGWLTSIGIVSLAVAAFGEYRVRTRYKELTEEVGALRDEAVELREAARAADEREQNAWALTMTLLNAVLAITLHDKKWFSSERISLFVDGGGDGLVLVARYADVRDWNKSRPREPYPYDRGCLGRAFSTGDTQYVTDLPHRGTDRTAWITSLHETCGYSRREAAEFTMPIRTIYARPVTSELGQNPIGAIVLESERIPGGDAHGEAVPNLAEDALDEFFVERERLFQLLLTLARQLREAAVNTRD
jgi:hypothetical protein